MQMLQSSNILWRTVGTDRQLSDALLLRSHLGCIKVLPTMVTLLHTNTVDDSDVIELARDIDRQIGKLAFVDTDNLLLEFNYIFEI